MASTGLWASAIADSLANTSGVGSLLSSMETELLGIINTMAELGEAATINGDSVNVIGITPYQDATLFDGEVQGRVVKLYCATSTFNATAAALGSTVVFRGVTYAIGRIEPRDPGITILELYR